MGVAAAAGAVAVAPSQQRAAMPARLSLAAALKQFDTPIVHRPAPGRVDLAPPSSPASARKWKTRGPRPGASPRITTKMLREGLPTNRLSAQDRADAERQMMNAGVHSWLLRHSQVAVPRAEMSRERRQILRDCFNALDADSSGTIDEYELGLAMTAMGFTKEDTRVALQIGDQNRDGELSFDEFMALFTYAWANRELQNDFTEGFARDISLVLGRRNATGDEGAVTTSFPFALVANSHRISRLIDGCNPSGRGDDPREHQAPSPAGGQW